MAPAEEMEDAQPVVAEPLHTPHSGKEECQCAHSDTTAAPDCPASIHTPLSSCPNLHCLPQDRGGSTGSFQVQ